MKTPRANHGASVKGDMLWAGGFTRKQVTSGVEMYNDIPNQWYLANAVSISLSISSHVCLSLIHECA